MNFPKVPLAEIFEIARGGSPRPIDRFITDDPNGIPWIMISDASASSKYISRTKKRIIPEGEKKSRRVGPGDFLLSNSMSFGKPYIMKTSGCIHDGWLVLSPRKEVSSDFFYHLLGSPVVYREFERRAAGATVKNLNIDLVKGVEVPLPPLEEQRRIAEVLDKADALRQKRRLALQKLDTLLQSVFLEMFGDPVKNPKGWEIKPLADVFRFTTGKLDSNAMVEGGEYPFFTCSRETFEIDRFAFDCEALLLAGNNATADYSVKYYKGKFNAYQRTYVITLPNKGDSYFYMRVALERKLRDLKRLSKGTNTKYLTLGILNDLEIQVPDSARQLEFEKHYREIEQIRLKHEAGGRLETKLFDSLQRKAFKGELFRKEDIRGQIQLFNAS